MNGWIILIIACTVAAVVDRVCETIVECKKVKDETFLKYHQCERDAPEEGESTEIVYS